MFTGLIERTGVVESIDRDGDGAVLAIAAQFDEAILPGASIAVNGVCLTVRDLGAGAGTVEVFRADVMEETFRRSALGALAPGDTVNVERSLAVGDRLDGHIVQGHIDGTGTVTAVVPEGFARVVRIEAPPALLRYIAAKGSIAIDGVSLTVVDAGERDFSVSLIPETLARTTLGDLAPGTKVNLETDVLAKHVERLLEFASPGAGAPSRHTTTDARDA